MHETPNIPICLPKNSPNMIPKLTGVKIIAPILLISIVIPEFASANAGMIINEDTGVRACSSLYKIDV